MSILLAILKIIGIVLLVVIGIVVFLLLLVLFCPICYRIKADHNEDNTNVDLKIRYIFVKTVASFVKGEGLKYKVKFLFFTLLNSENKKDDEDDEDGMDVMDLDPNDDFSGSGFFDEPSQNNDAESLENQDSDEEAEGQAAKETQDNDNSPEDASADVTEVTETSETEANESEVIDSAATDTDMSDTEAEVISKIQTEDDLSVIDKIDDGLEKISNKTDELVQKCDKIATKIEHVEQFIEKPFVQKTFKRAFKIIKKLFGTIKPKKSSGYLKFGLSSAASTGEMLGRLARVYPLYGRWLEIEPDFYHKVIEANVDIKGRIYIFRIVGPALRLLISRDFWRTLKLAKKI